MNQSETVSMPFFARFLETQKVVETRDQNDPWPIPTPTKPLGDAWTEKWPSDYEDAL